MMVPTWAFVAVLVALVLLAALCLILWFECGSARVDRDYWQTMARLHMKHAEVMTDRFWTLAAKARGGR